MEYNKAIKHLKWRVRFYHLFTMIYIGLAYSNMTNGETGWSIIFVIFALILVGFIWFFNKTIKTMELFLKYKKTIDDLIEKYGDDTDAINRELPEELSGFEIVFKRNKDKTNP